MTDPLPEAKTYEIEGFALQSGEVLEKAVLAYRTYGTLNADKSNAIIYPTSYGVVDADVAWLIGPDGILDPTRYFIIALNMFGNGASSSPSNLPRDAQTGKFPRFTHVDNVTAQHRLITGHFGIERLALAYGWSMGAQQSLHWGALFPDSVARIFAICGTAKTSVHNCVFLESLRATLTTDPAWDGSQFTSHPERGLRAFGRVYAGWALSQSFYRDRVHESLGYPDVSAFLEQTWDKTFLHRDPHNLLSLLDTWQDCDISANDRFNGDLAAALGAITARTVHMASSTDLYFRARDIRAEAGLMPNGRYGELRTVWGHRGGNPQQSPADATVLRSEVRTLLDT